MQTFKIGDRSVGTGEPAYVIAEAGINHNGDMERAQQMVHVAKEVGVDCIKFQTFTAEGIMTKSAASAAHLDAGAGMEDVYTFLQRMALSREDHEVLFALCGELGLNFLSSVFEPASVDLLENLGVSAYKIASMDLIHLTLLKYVAETGKPIVLSTGMGTMGEIERALDTIYSTGNEQVVLLHCVSVYPPDIEDVNLRAMDTIRTAFNVPVGFSDHTVGITVDLAAVARGGCVIEKHFTLDKTLPGPDQPISGDPDDFRRLVSGVRTVEAALGSAIKRPTEAEMGMRNGMRRSVVSAVDIGEGTAVTEDMVTFKRPGSGIPPSDLAHIVGRTTRREIPADTLVEYADFA